MTYRLAQRPLQIGSANALLLGSDKMSLVEQSTRLAEVKDVATENCYRHEEIET